LRIERLQQWSGRRSKESVFLELSLLGEGSSQFLDIWHYCSGMYGYESLYRRDFRQKPWHKTLLH
jgi:hypothetical protein